MLPEFLKTKQKISERHFVFFKWAVDQNMHPWFKEIPKRIMYEGSTIMSKHSETITFETPVEKIATNFTVSTSEILENPYIIFEKLFNCAPEFARQQTVNMIESISTATTAVGNNFRIQDITPELFLEMIDRLEIPFDSNGMPRFPQVMAGSAMIEKFARMERVWNSNPEYERKVNEIINRKRTKWNDRQAARKLAE